VLRPSVVFGENDSFLNPRARLLRVAPMLLLPCGKARVQPVYVEDVARICVDALDRPDTYGQTLALCGPRVYTLLELARWLAATMGLERRIVSLNESLSFTLAALTEWLPAAPLTRDMVLSLSTNSICDSDFPTFAGPPMALEAVVPAWLNGTGSRLGFDRYRAHH